VGDQPVDPTRRHFWSTLIRDTMGCVTETRKALEETRRFTEFFSTTDSSYALSRHYPRELFEEEASRLGIDIDAVGIDEAVKQIFAHAYGETE